MSAPTSPTIQSQVYFHPSIWSDYFITSSQHDLKPDLQILEKIKQLKEEVNEMLKDAENEQLPQMNLIDNIRRLGLAYHFESEIENALKMIYDNNHQNHDMYAIALRFRLLRQAGYYVSPDVFKIFKDEGGEFHQKLSEDIQVLLSMYEAAHLGYKGEDILDEAIAFTTRRLKLMLSHHLISSPLARKVQHALELPLQKRNPRLEAKHYILMYQEDDSRIQPLLQFAKLDFNMVQLLHQRELSEICRWWKDVDLMPKLPMSARDRAVETYAVVVGMIDEPQYSLGRTYTTKLFTILFVVDDLFDVYKKMDELQLLTDAILRWDVGSLVGGPEYLKDIVTELIKLINEYGDELAKRGQPCNISYFKHALQQFIRFQMEELKVFQAGVVPTLSDWHEITLFSGGIPFMVMGSLLDTKEHATQKTLDWAVNNPEIIRMTSKICVFLGDIKSYKLEQSRGNMASNVTCYMKEHGVCEVIALENLGKMINDLWKDINKECLRPIPMPMHLLVISINLARVVQVLYIYDDAFTEARGQTKEVIASMLARPAPV